MSNQQDTKKKNPNVPNLRFGSFDGIWFVLPLSSFAKKKNVRNFGNHISNVVCNSAQHGLIPQRDFFDKDIANDANTDKYWVIEEGDFVYNPRISNVAPYGPVNRYSFSNKGVVSPLYFVFMVSGIDKSFLLYRFQSPCWYRFMYLHGDSGARSDRVSIRDEIFLSQKVFYPNEEEQRKIAAFLRLVDHRIETQNKIIEDLEILRKGIVDQFFNRRKNDHSAPLSTFLSERKAYAEKGGDFEHVTLSKEGIIPKTDRYDRDFLVKDEEKQYKITLINDICYNPANLKFGVVCLNDYGSAIFSPIYVTFEVIRMDPRYVAFFLKSALFMNQALRFEQGTVYERMSVSPEDFTRIKIPLVSSDQQASFVKLAQCLTDKEVAEKGKLHLLQLQKAYLLQNMFI